MATDFNRYTEGEENRYLSRLPAKDRAQVERFITERSSLKAGKALSRGRVKKILFSLTTLRALSPVPFGELTEDHMIDVLDALKKKGWTANTTRDVIAVFKPFLTWMVEKKQAPALTEAWIGKIKIPRMESRKIRPEDLLTEAEIKAIIKAASPRDRAVISLMADAGLRPIEAGTLRFSDLEFIQGGLYVHVGKKKTDRIRRIPAPNARYYVQRWIDEAPYPIQGDDPLFRSSRRDDTGEWLPLMDDTLRLAIKGAASRAGVTRYKHPYQFRHGAITRWINAGVSTAKVAKLSHGGPSRMVEEVYWHGDDDAIGQEILEKVHGAPAREKKVVNPTTRMCQVCGKIYPISVRYCETCGPLTEEARETMDKMLADIVANPEGLVTILRELQARRAAGKDPGGKT